MNPLCPACRSPLSPDCLDGLCPACFFEAAAVETVTTAEGGTPAPGLALPGLVIRRELARGGMGIVYEAEQARPHRQVALKVLHPQWSANPAVRERFRREAEAMARLDHPDILPVHEVGETDGLPWFTMKFAGGGSLVQRLGRYAGRGRDSAALVARLARALAFAHGRGVLHRDVKPANILFDDGDHACLADFGLAKLEAAGRDLHALTLEAQVLGTPHYLAPEVAAGQSEGTTAGDTYGLGAVLFELLAGRPPHEADTLPALLRRVASGEPVSWEGVQPPPPKDLRAICECALARDLERRYGSARELAEDLERFLRGEEVQARDLTVLESLWHWARRHPVVAALAVTVAFLLGALAVTTTLAVSGRQRAEANLRTGLLAEADGVRRSHLPGFRRRALELVAAAGSADEDEEMRRERIGQAIAALAYPELVQHPAPLLSGPWDLAVVSPGQRFHAWTGTNGWRVTRGKDGTVIGEGTAPGRPVLLSRNGQTLVLQLAGVWQVWRLEGREAVLRHEFAGIAEDVSDDGELIAAHRFGPAERCVAEVREAGSGALRFTREFPLVSLKQRFSPDGRLCAIAPSSYVNHAHVPYTVRLHRTADGTVERELSSGLANCIWALAWSPDGRHLAAGERGGATLVWDAATGNPRHVLRGLGANVWRLAFSEDQQWLALLGADRLLTVLDLNTGIPVMRGGETEAVKSVGLLAWSAEEAEVFGPVTVDGRLTYLQLRAGAWSNFRAPESHGSALGLAASPDGRWLAVGDSRNARLWDVSGKLPRLQEVLADNLWNDFVFSGDGRHLYGCGESGVHRWRLTADGAVPGSRQQLLPGNLHNSLALDRRGERLVAQFDYQNLAAVVEQPAGEAPRRREVAAPSAMWVALRPDGGQWVAGGWQGLQFWSVGAEQPFHSEPRACESPAYSPDGRWCAAALQQPGTDSYRYEVWSAGDVPGRVATLSSRPVTPAEAAVAFSPDGRWLATGHPFGRLALWSVGDWKLVGLLRSPGGTTAGRLAFAADSRTLYAAGDGGLVEAWDLARLERELGERNLAW